MATVQLNLPDDLKAAADLRAAAVDVSFDQYVADLIEADSADDAIPVGPELEAELQKGLDSGPPVELTDELLEGIRARVRARHS